MAGVLDTDVATLLPLVRRGLDWWLAELADLARPLLRERGRAGERTIAVRRAAGGYALQRDGNEVGLASASRPAPAALVLPAEIVLVRDLEAEGLSRRDWLRLLDNDIDRLTPFAASDVYAAVGFLQARDGATQARVAVVPRRQADAALREAVAAGVTPTAVLAPVPGGEHLDLTPAVRSATQGGGRPRSGRWWLAVTLLAALNVGAAVWRDVRDTDRLQAEVDRQQPVAARVATLRARVLAEAARRQALVAAQAGGPLQALAAASRALPDGAWLQRFGEEGGQVRLAGYHRPGLDVLAALQADPGFADVHSASADLGASAVSATLGEAFDVVAALRAKPPGPRR